MCFGFSTFTPSETCKEISSLQTIGFPSELGFNANPETSAKLLCLVFTSVMKYV